MYTETATITLKLKGRFDKDFRETDLADRIKETVTERLCNPEREDGGALRVMSAKPDHKMEDIAEAFRCIERREWMNARAVLCNALGLKNEDDVDKWKLKRNDD